jgi:hypothetical protein
MTERLNLLSYRRNLRRRSTSKSDYTRWRGPSVRGGRPTQETARSAASFIFKQADHVAYWQILFQTVSALQVPVAIGCAHSAGAMEVLLAVIV